MAETLTNLLYHCILPTKDLEPVLCGRRYRELLTIMGEILESDGGDLLVVGGAMDHAHAILRLPAQVSVARTLARISSESCRWLNAVASRASRFAWDERQLVFSVSASVLPAMRSYIENQDEHHRVCSFAEEVGEFLERQDLDARLADALAMN